MSALSVTVGIDVAKAHVDVCVLGTHSDVQRFANDVDAPRRWLLPCSPWMWAWW